MTKRTARIKKRLKYIILVSLDWFAIHKTLIIIDGLNDELEPCQVAVIFGNKVNVDGSLSDRLKARVDKGLELYQAGIVQKLFVSGGLGSEGQNEGDKMAEYLITQGVHSKHIKIDNKGNNSGLTAVNFKKEYPKIEKVILVSQYYHISRAKLAFRKSGISLPQGAHCEYFEFRDFYSLFREFFGFYKYWLFD
jgi:vancomycin permeability regulator SanA